MDNHDLDWFQRTMYYILDYFMDFEDQEIITLLRGHKDGREYLARHGYK